MFRRTSPPVLSWLVGVLLLAGCSAVAPGVATEQPSAADSTPTPTPVAEALQVGDCTATLMAGSAKQPEAISCEDDHYWEVFAIVAITQESLPTDSQFETLAATECLSAFSDYVGVEPIYSRYDSVYLVPDQVAWENPDERTITCLLGSADGGVSGSAKGDTSFLPAVGECTGTQDVPALEVEVLSCKSEHYWEIYAEKKLTSKKAPSDDDLATLVKEVCVDEFESFVGVDQSESDYSFTYFVTPSQVWDKVEDKRLVCSVGSAKGDITGSLKGSKK